MIKTHFHIGTSFPKIGTEEFPYDYQTMAQALDTVRKIKESGYGARIHLIQEFTVDTVIYDTMQC